jgi:hypothetical protein
MDAEVRADLDRVATSLTDGWNAADGVAFARCFTADADFVNIFALHVVGREAVYRGSRNAFSIVDARALAGNVKTLASAVFVRDDLGWLIASFHNTREQQPSGRPD